jgi:hypothetical protein
VTIVSGKISKDFRDYPRNQSNFIEDGIRASHLMRAGYQHVNAYFPWFNFDPTWWPGVSGLDATFEAVATAVRPATELALDKSHDCFFHRVEDAPWGAGAYAGSVESSMRLPQGS